MSARPPSPWRLQLAVQYPDTLDGLAKQLPRWKLRNWVRAAQRSHLQLVLRLTDRDEQQALNREFRGKDYPTNVLTFPYNDDEVVDEDAVYAADVALCWPVLLEEAQAQSKTWQHHAAHLVVHGALHAQGYDHEVEADAEQMEALEVEILARLGIANPYESKA